jgi:hypothetical protein
MPSSAGLGLDLVACWSWDSAFADIGNKPLALVFYTKMKNSSNRNRLRFMWS